MKKRMRALAALATAAVLVLTGCSFFGGGDSGAGDDDGSNSATSADGITLWLAGGDTPDELRDYLKKKFTEKTGKTLTIEQQDWGGLVSKLKKVLPNAKTTPDVVEMGNTQSPTFTNVGMLLDITDMYGELGGDNLLPGFVEAGTVDGRIYMVPYYFGSRFVFYRKDIWDEAKVEIPKTFDEFNAAVKKLAKVNPRHIPNFSGIFLGPGDWRNGITWIFANGGELAKQVDGKWVSTLSDKNTIKGLEQLQSIDKHASRVVGLQDQRPWLFLNDHDYIVDAQGRTLGETSLEAAAIMAPNWAHFSLGNTTKDESGELVKNDAGIPLREWDDEKFGVLVIPGNDGKPAPVFAGGSNIGISAKSQHPDLAKELLRIIFSPEYQKMLGEAGLGPANQKYVSSLGDDVFAKATAASASNSKLTPAAPGWADVEARGLLEEFFTKIDEGADIEALAKEYDEKITPLLNKKS